MEGDAEVKSTKPLKTYMVTFTPWLTSESFITTSAAKAKYLYFIQSDDVFNCSFFELLKHLKVRCLGGPETSEEFIKNAEYRQIPFAHCGMAVKVGGMLGHIVGHNSSANLDVLFAEGKYRGMVLNCHPHSDVEYYSADGTLIKAFKTKAA